MTAALPTANCLPVDHEHEGGCCYCCDDCNYDRHICHFCGDSLRHDGRLYNGSLNTCYAKCECGHIGHEHYSKGTCRGYDYELGGDTECGCTDYRPVAS